MKLTALQKFFELDNIIKFLKMNIFKLFIIYIMFKIAKIFKGRIEKILNLIFEKSNMDKSIASFLISLYSVVYYFILIYISIGILGINTTSITTFLGAAGIVFGIAFKETLGNFCGGIIILTFKPFRVGDTIEYNNYIGTVKRIELFYTKIINPQNELVIIPNGIITNTEIRNIREDGERRLDLTVGVSYNSDIQKVKEVIIRIVKEETMDKVEEDKRKENLFKKWQSTVLESKEKKNIKINFFSTLFSKKKMEEAEKSAHENLREELDELEEVEKEKSFTEHDRLILPSRKPIIGVGELADSAIIFYVYVYTRTENYIDLKLKLNEKIKLEFEKEGIEIPYPQMDVMIKNKK